MYDENTMIEKPRLCINHVASKDGGFLFALTKAGEIARQSGMDWDAIRSEAMAGGAVNGMRVLHKYFTVI